MRGGSRQNQKLFILLQLVQKAGMVSTPCLDKGVKLAELLPTYRCLDVERLQAVTEMAVDVFVVVAMGQVAQLPVEALIAGVVLAGSAPAIAAPVAEGFRNAPQAAAVCQNRAALTHCDVMRRVKTLGR